MKKDVFNGKRLKIARVYRGKSVDILAKETNINKKDILAFEDNKYKPTLENASNGFPAFISIYANKSWKAIRCIF